MNNEIPYRVQRKRTKGWKNPKNTIYVGRPTKWGNPFIIGKEVDPKLFSILDITDTLDFFINGKTVSSFDAVYLFEKYCIPKLKGIETLKGKNLSCFCPLNQPCHANILLKIANKL